MIPPWFQACIYWNKSFRWQHHFLPSIFSMIVSFFHMNAWGNPYVRITLFISQHLLQPSIIISGLWLIREKLKSMFISAKTLLSCSFKGTYLFHRTSCNNFCLWSTVLNAEKHLQRSHSFMMNVLIWQFHNSDCKYSLSIVNVLEELL